MSIHLIAIAIKHRRRIRLLFSNTLAAGAFTTLTYYTITSQDSVGISPPVVAALVVAGNTAEVELALGDDLSPGGKYLISAIGVPAGDASTTDGTSSQQAVFGAVQVQTNAEQVANDTEVLLYGRDIVWTGSDFAETPNGDLAIVSGGANVHGALYRRLTSAGLPWDPNYGPNARAYVNSPAPSITTLRGAMLAQCGLDDRVKTATVVLETDSNNAPIFDVTPTLIGGQGAQTLTITVPTS